MAKGITRGGIVATALEVLDEKGIDAVTVREVAARLGVRAPALYHHVHNKRELLDEMGTEVQRRTFTRLASHTWSGDWLDDLAAYAHALRTEYLEHRDGARTFGGTLITDPDVLRRQEPWLQRWVDSGVSADSAFLGVEIVTAFVVGYVIEEQERAQSADAPLRYGPVEREHRLGSATPLVVAAGYARDDTDRFDRQLSIIVAGLGLLKDGRPTR